MYIHSHSIWSAVVAFTFMQQTAIFSVCLKMNEKLHYVFPFHLFKPLLTVYAESALSALQMDHLGYIYRKDPDILNATLSKDCSSLAWIKLLI